VQIGKKRRKREKKMIESIVYYDTMKTNISLVDTH